MTSNEWMLQLYHCLPAPLRSGIASLHGKRLSAWRYGAETETLVMQAHEREHWTLAQWQNWHAAQLESVLARALTVPFYRQRWDDCRRAGNSADPRVLANWALLEKDVLRANPRAFLTPDAPAKLEQEHTSGTTGKPISLWYSQETAQAWYALFEARWRRWYGVTRQERWAILGGKMIAPVRQQSPPFWVWNSGFGQLYLSVYHLQPRHVPAYLTAMRDHRVTYLYAYTSAAATLAQEILAQNLTPPPLSVILTNAEPLYAHQRALIEQAFQCPVRETYGMSEMAAGASECEHGRLHLWLDAGYTEILDEQDQPVFDQPGRVVTTGLLNKEMPLVRYLTGDRAVLASTGNACPCGRTLPVLSRIEGRDDDILFTPDGREVGRLDPVFKADLRIKEAQIIQDSLNHVMVLVVPAANYGDAQAHSIRRRLEERLGAMTVDIRAVDSIPRSANGKFRAVVCRLTQAEKAQLRRSRQTS